MTETETEVEVDLDGELGTVDEMVVEMLGDIESDHIDNQMLIDIYVNL